MNSFSANTREQLQKILNNIPIVSPRSAGVSKQEVEEWCVCRLLATLSETDELQFPVIGDPGDKPDFKLCMPNIEIGVEVTKATSELYERARAICDQNYPDVVLELSHFKWGATPKSNDEISEILRTSRHKYTGPVFYGNYIGNYWAKDMFSRLSHKTNKLNQTDFYRLSQNWLLIFDTLTLPGLDYDLSLRNLMQNISGYWQNQSQSNTAFDRVIIETWDKLLFISEKGVTKADILNLW